jgi:hypothetical protein
MAGVVDCVPQAEASIVAGVVMVVAHGISPAVYVASAVPVVPVVTAGAVPRGGDKLKLTRTAAGGWTVTLSDIESSSGTVGEPPARTIFGLFGVVAI